MKLYTSSPSEMTWQSGMSKKVVADSHDFDLHELDKRKAKLRHLSSKLLAEQIYILIPSFFFFTCYTTIILLLCRSPDKLLVRVG